MGLKHDKGTDREEKWSRLSMGVCQISFVHSIWISILNAYWCVWTLKWNECSRYISCYFHGIHIHMLRLVFDYENFYVVQSLVMFNELYQSSWWLRKIWMVNWWWIGDKFNWYEWIELIMRYELVITYMHWWMTLNVHRHVS